MSPAMGKFRRGTMAAEPEPSSVVLTARIPSGIHRRAKARLVRDRVSFQDAVLAEVTRIADGGVVDAEVVPPPEGLSRSEARWVAALLRLLRGANRAARLAVCSTLRALDRQAE